MRNLTPLAAEFAEMIRPGDWVPEDVFQPEPGKTYFAKSSLTGTLWLGSWDTFGAMRGICLSDSPELVGPELGSGVLVQSLLG